MDVGISGKRALVLSGGGGLGSAIALALARESALICVAGRTQAPLNVTANAIQELGGEAHTFTFDLGIEEQWSNGIDRVLERVGGIDILINNTGGPQPGPAFGHAALTWRSAFESMVIPVIGITDRILPGMRERKWGRIITSTSSGV